MKSKTIGWVAAAALVVVVMGGAVAIGVGVGRNRGGSAAPVKANAARSRPLWHCGMHPQVIQDHPGDCPICHMALTPVSGSAAEVAESGVAAATAEVVIDPAAVQNMGVRTARVT